MQGNLSIAGLACVVLLAGCGEVNVRKYLPFGGDPIQERSRTPANATEYQCAAGKRIYVRTLEGGAARQARCDGAGPRSRARAAIASATWGDRTAVAPSRSATVRATRRTFP